MSRVTDGIAGQRLDSRAHGRGRRRSAASRSISATYTARARAAPCARRRPAPAGRARRCGRRRVTTAAARPGTSQDSRCGSVRVSTRSASQTRSTTPFMSKKSTSRAPPLQCSPPPLPVQAHATARRSPAAAREAAADLEQAHVALLAPAVVRDGIDQPGQRRRAQHGEVLGQRVGDRHQVAVGRERRRGGLGDEAERHRLGEAGRRSGRARSWRARAMRGSDGGGAAVSAGNVTGIRSKP